MDRQSRVRGAWIIRLVVAAMTVALLAGCAAADKNAHPAHSTAADQMAAMTSSGTAVGSKQNTSQAAQEAAVDDITPIPTQALGTAFWQGMKISAMAMTPVPFVVDDGTSESEVKPTTRTTFHLMVSLNDAVTNEPIPYSTVWAVIRQHGRIVFNERQWPMISRYLGPHYGNDVTLPGPGTYQLSLLVSPPAAARHMEYAKVWLKSHTAVFTFHWQPVE